ncbi:hypothetical protein IFM89_030922 [Coptis chinensis]|uniref:Cyclin-dependent kinase inhibitor n=1 Tax=Coptis chinensis TaxID=261450 RepID=A0A835HPV7_9MAGN|nr:hypothetical protein IFM89_030922 [Coptis chinensis]
MGKFMRKCKRNSEVVVMEAQLGVRTRARSKVLAALAEASESKRRKLISSSYMHGSTLKETLSEQNSVSSQVLVSNCSSNGSSELVNDSLRSVEDLEYESHEIENLLSYKKEQRTYSSSEFNELDSLERQSEEANYRQNSTAEKMPTETEIDDFFSVAEKEEKKRFEEKYNYDVIKDVPLEGRFEWIEMKL